MSAASWTPSSPATASSPSRSYVAKVGRAQFIEIHLAVPAGMQLGDITAVDAIRREIAEAIGGEGPQRWLTIDFTADPRWL